MHRLHGHRHTTTCESYAVSTNEKLRVSGYTLGKPSTSTHMEFPLSDFEFPCWTETTTLEARPVSSLLHSEFPASTATSKVTSKYRRMVFKTYRLLRVPGAASYN